MDKFRNKYRIESARLKNWDYASCGMYFVTVCSKDRINWFGEIINGGMSLSEIGKITEKYWLKISRYHPFVELDQHIVMPNHIHGIINIVETPYMASQNIAFHNQNKFGPQSKNVASIIRGFKLDYSLWSCHRVTLYKGSSLGVSDTGDHFDTLRSWRGEVHYGGN